MRGSDETVPGPRRHSGAKTRRMVRVTSLAGRPSRKEREVDINHDDDVDDQKEVAYLIRLASSFAKCDDESVSNHGISVTAATREGIYLPQCNDNRSNDGGLNNELRTGAALRKTYANFVKFDSELREELLRQHDYFSIVEELPALPQPELLPEEEKDEDSSSPPAGSFDELLRPSRRYGGRKEGQLNEYLARLVRIPEVVRSMALSSFLSVPEEEDDKEDRLGVAHDNDDDKRRRRRLCVDYLLQHSMDSHPGPDEEGGDDVVSSCSSSFQRIPRGGQHVVELDAVPPGWWIVWQFRVEVVQGGGGGGKPALPFPVGGGRDKGCGGGGGGSPKRQQREWIKGNGRCPPSPRHPLDQFLHGLQQETQQFVQEHVAQGVELTLSLEEPQSLSVLDGESSDRTVTNKLVATDETTSRAETHHDDQVSASSSFSSSTAYTPTPSSPPIASKPEVVHRERITLPSVATHRGSYRIPPPASPDHSSPSSHTCCSLPVCAKLQFTNAGSLSLLRQSQVWVETAIVPHETFGAACAAALDQNEADARKDRAPLLRALLDSRGWECGVGGLVVERFVPTEEGGEEEKDDKDEEREGAASAEDDREDEEETCGAGEEEAPPSPRREGGTSQNGGEAASESLTVHPDILAKEEEISHLRTEISTLRSERDQLQSNLLQTRASNDDAQNKLRLLQSEKRVWNVARSEIQGEMSRLAEQIGEERKLRLEVEKKLELRTKEAKALGEELMALETSFGGVVVDRGGGGGGILKDNVDENKGVDEGVQRQGRGGVVTDLEREVESLKGQNAVLEATIDIQKKSTNDLLLHARADADEARMMQRMLEGKVRQLERTLKDEKRKKQSSSFLRKSKRHSIGATGATTAAVTVRRLDSATLAFVHPDERLNHQLVELRQRHETLVSILERNPDNNRNAELLQKMERAIRDIVSSGIASSNTRGSGKRH